MILGFLDVLGELKDVCIGEMNCWCREAAMRGISWLVVKIVWLSFGTVSL